MCFGNSDERFWLSFGEALSNVANTHTGVDKNRNRSRFEERECQDEKLQRRRNHQNRAYTASNSKLLQSASQGIADFVQFTIRQLRVVGCSVCIA